VTLTHPDAPAEQRVIKVAPGESMQLDVAMKLSAGRPQPSSVASAEPTPRSGS